MKKSKCLSVLISLSFLAVCICLVTAFPLKSFAGEPTDQIKQTIDNVIKILNNKELKKPEKKQERKKRYPRCD